MDENYAKREGTARETEEFAFATKDMMLSGS